MASAAIYTMAILFLLASWRFDMKVRDQLEDRKVCATAGTIAFILASAAMYLAGH